VPISIRRANMDADRSELTELLCRNLSSDAGGVRFDWLYFKNPHGSARVWTAVESASDRMVGAAAAFPRRFFVAGSTRLGQVLGDFCIDQQHRSLGLALQLQRACLDDRSSQHSAIGYDFPSDRMMAVYRRMRLSPMGQMIRWAKPLRTERRMGLLFKSPTVAKVFAAPINKLLEWRDGPSPASLEAIHEWVIEVYQRPCEEEFTRLAHNVGFRYGACIERSAEYLNWRFRRHPLVRYEFLTARRGKELLGYLVFSQTADDAKIVDLFGIDDAAMWTALIRHLVGLLRPLGTVTISAPALSSNPWVILLKRLGFHPREGCPIVVHAPQGRTPEGIEALSWFLTDGDRES